MFDARFEVILDQLGQTRENIGHKAINAKE